MRITMLRLYCGAAAVALALLGGAVHQLMPLLLRTRWHAIEAGAYCCLFWLATTMLVKYTLEIVAAALRLPAPEPLPAVPRPAWFVARQQRRMLTPPTRALLVLIDQFALIWLCGLVYVSLLLDGGNVLRGYAVAGPLWMIADYCLLLIPALRRSRFVATTIAVAGTLLMVWFVSPAVSHALRQPPAAIRPADIRTDSAAGKCAVRAAASRLPATDPPPQHPCR